jgi:transposase
MTMLAETVDVVIGVDTHKHTHSAAVVNAAPGGVRITRTVPADPRGYEELALLAESHGTRRAWAIEGTGSFGSGLTRFLTARGERVIELDRASRVRRRDGAKNDSIDAVRAAREVLAREKLAEPRARGERAALAALLMARRSAVLASTAAQRQLGHLVMSAPEILAKRFRGLNTSQILSRGAHLRMDAAWDTETAATARVLRSLARRALELNAEAEDHKQVITTVVRALRADLLDVFGVGPIVAAVVLCAWSHQGRCRSEAAFAKLGGVAPIEASSGQTTRHRLSRCGDRQLNQALHTVVLVRLRHDDASRTYAQRRRAEGKSDREIKRCLKRYVARELYRLLEHGQDRLDAT